MISSCSLFEVSTFAKSDFIPNSKSVAFFTIPYHFTEVFYNIAARQPNRSIFWIVFVPTFWWKLLIKLICSQSKPFMIFYRYCWLLLGRSIINWAFKALVYASFNFIAQHNFVYCFKSINGVFSCRFLDSSNAALPLSDVAFENFYKLISD